MTEASPCPWSEFTAVGADKIQRHLFLCADQTKPKCVDKEAGLASWDYLKRRLKELKLTGDGGVFRTKANCLQVCTRGPIAVVYPEAVWYGFVTPDDVPEIVDRHLTAGEPVARLRLDDACVNTGACAHKPRAKA